MPWLPALVLVTACTVSGHASAPSSSSLPDTPSPTPTPADRTVEPVAQALVSWRATADQTTITATDVVRVMKYRADNSDGSRQNETAETVLLFPLTKDCIRSATLLLGTPNGSFPARGISVYPSALGTSTLRATSNPRVIPGLYTLLDNRPRSIVELDAGQATADVTEAAQIWSHGGPFPGGRAVHPDSPLALDIIESDITPGAFDVSFGKPVLQVRYASTGPCEA